MSLSDQIDLEDILPSRGSAQTGRRGGKVRDRKNDLHETPAVAVKALLKVERLPRAIWEPCAGRGAIVKPLVEAGHTVYSTDLVNHGFHGFDCVPGVDFLLERQMWAPTIDGIVTNPPFKNANEFVHKAVELSPYVACLLRLGFLEGSKNKKRTELLDGGKLARVYVFANRLPRMHRDGWTGKRAGPTTVFMWAIWECNHRGPWTGHRITWESE